jgi:hypothetical protein
MTSSNKTKFTGVFKMYPRSCIKVNIRIISACWVSNAGEQLTRRLMMLYTQSQIIEDEVVQMRPHLILIAEMLKSVLLKNSKLTIPNNLKEKTVKMTSGK